MRFWLTRDSRSFIAAAMLSTGLAACSSGTPTAPSALSAGDAAPNAVTTSVSSSTVPASTAQTTAADTTKITQGTLAIDTGLPGTVTLKGTHGFRFDGQVSTSGRLPSSNCASDPCQPGATVAFTAAWVGSDIPGTVRLQGDEFAAGCGDTCTNMYIELTGSFVAPAHLTDTASVTVPFAAWGRFSRGYPYPSLELTGRGSVTLTLEWQPFIGGWGISFSSFDFGGGPRSS